jgi:UDP-glucose 4-epimerase
MNILVTGAAGYIGSHTCRYLATHGHEIVAYDNLSRGHRQAVERALPNHPFVLGDLHDVSLLRGTMQQYHIEAVVHFAAFALVGESVENPELYQRNNVEGTRCLIEAATKEHVQKFVFSSTTAIYGEPESIPVTESCPARPISPYGQTKLDVERLLEQANAEHGLGFAALRYFNAAGADPAGDIGEDHDPETHLIPIVLQVALGQRKNISVFGDDYATPDGTCVRDYVHVLDLADAHLRALDQMQEGQLIQINLGSGTGHSVMEIIEAARAVTGKKIQSVVVARRSGDPPLLIADNQLARDTLGWQPQHSSIEEIMSTAWNWHQSHPLGYSSTNAKEAGQ